MGLTISYTFLVYVAFFRRDVMQKLKEHIYTLLYRNVRAAGLYVERHQKTL